MPGGNADTTMQDPMQTHAERSPLRCHSRRRGLRKASPRPVPGLARAHSSCSPRPRQLLGDRVGAALRRARGRCEPGLALGRSGRFRRLVLASAARLASALRAAAGRRLVRTRRRATASARRQCARAGAHRHRTALRAVRPHAAERGGCWTVGGDPTVGRRDPRDLARARARAGLRLGRAADLAVALLLLGVLVAAAVAWRARSTRPGTQVRTRSRRLPRRSAAVRAQPRRSPAGWGSRGAPKSPPPTAIAAAFGVEQPARAALLDRSGPRARRDCCPSRPGNVGVGERRRRVRARGPRRRLGHGTARPGSRSAPSSC